MPYGNILHIKPTNCHILAAKQGPYQKAYFSRKQKNPKQTKYTLKNLLGKKNQENGPVGRKKRQDRKSSGTGQKNKRGDTKEAPNDSLKFQTGGETSDISGFPSRSLRKCTCNIHLVWPKQSCKAQ